MLNTAHLLHFIYRLKVILRWRSYTIIVWHIDVNSSHLPRLELRFSTTVNLNVYQYRFTTECSYRGVLAQFRFSNEFPIKTNCGYYSELTNSNGSSTYRSNWMNYRRKKGRRNRKITWWSSIIISCSSVVVEGHHPSIRPFFHASSFQQEHFYVT